MDTVDEKHELEQYFFDRDTIAELAELVDCFENPCCVCTPMLAQALLERGREVALFDVDERFSSLPGFRKWDLERPVYLDEEFDFVICDPPFFNVSLRQLFHAMRTLTHFRYDLPLAMTYLSRRKGAFLRAMGDFELVDTGYRPRYETVEDSAKNEIALFANFELPFDVQKAKS